MHKGAKSKCTSSSHRLMVDNAKNRLDDLQERFSNLQAARQQGRVIDVAVLEEQVYQSIREWKAELDAPSRESSLVEGSLGSFSADIARLLQLCEEEDDATSALAGQQVLKPEPVPEPNVQSFNVDNNFTSCQQDYLVHSSPQGHNFQMFDQSNMSLGFQNMTDVSSPLDFQQLILDEGFTIDFVHDTKDLEKVPETSDPTYVSPPPSAFMGPKCALWDCSRPAQGYDLYKDYCSSFHSNLSSSEGAPGSKPVLRPKGIGLKDSLLFNAVVAKAQGQDVGIPLCKGAASMKSPWNATELFDLSLLEGETLREWLFFDKPRRAFDSGNRKQRSLPDYNGRGWHESRKQVMKEFDGQKRSYYMDPQPPGFYEWHLFEYEMNNCDAFALYRLELKLAEKKKTPKGKVPKDSLADLRKKMGRLTAEVTADDSPVDKASVKSGNSSNAEVSDPNQDQKFIGMGSLGQISVQSPLK